MKKNLLMTALFALANSVFAATPEQNKATALNFYDMVFNQHKVQEASDKYIGKEYLQHNPLLPMANKLLLMLLRLF